MKKYLGAILAAVVTVAIVAVPADAKKKSAPERVGLITMVSSTETSLTFTWDASTGATGYEVERATDLHMSNRSMVRSTYDNTITVTGLTPGQMYCFQVRAVNSSERARRSKKGCQTPIVDQGSRSGTKYRVVAYNTCSRKCGSWGDRKGHAADLIRAQNPDVVTLEETDLTASRDLAADLNMTLAIQKSGKALLYKTSRFYIPKQGGQPRVGSFQVGYDADRDKGRYAVWAELAEKSGDYTRALFAGVHLSPGKDSLAKDARRQKETNNLVSELDQRNNANLPVIIGGDFNSHQGRDHDSPSEVLEGAGMASSFFNAESWRLPNFNTGNKGKATPTIGKAWGYHIDQVWFDPSRTVVTEWKNADSLVGGKYETPMPSNHSPMMAELIVS